MAARIFVGGRSSSQHISTTKKSQKKKNDLGSQKWDKKLFEKVNLYEKKASCLFRDQNVQHICFDKVEFRNKKKGYRFVSRLRVQEPLHAAREKTPYLLNEAISLVDR